MIDEILKGKKEGLTLSQARKMYGELADQFYEEELVTREALGAIERKLSDIESVISNYQPEKFPEIKIPAEISVKKPDWYKEPKEVKEKEFPSEMNVVVKNFPEKEEKELDITPIIKQLEDLRAEVKSLDLKVNVSQPDRITVDLSDSVMKPQYKATTLPVVIANPEDLKEKQWIPADPTTGRLQMRITEAVEVVSGNVAGPLATEAKQDDQITLLTTLGELIETLNELNARMTAIAAVKQTSNETLRIMPVNAAGAASTITTVTAVGTVTTLTGQTNFGGVSAYTLAIAQQNANAVLSNINNVVVT
jgi:hypothetical protein